MHTFQEKTKLIQRMETIEQRMGSVEEKVDHMIEIGLVTKENTDTIHQDMQSNQNEIKSYIQSTKIQLSLQRKMVSLMACFIAACILFIIYKI